MWTVKICLRHPRLPSFSAGIRSVIQLRNFTSTNYYHKSILERAQTCSNYVSHDDAAKYLSHFIDKGYDATQLRGFLKDGRNGDSGLLSIDDYLMILQLCKLIEFHDMDLLSSLSEDLRLAFVTLYKPLRRGRIASKSQNCSDPADISHANHMPARIFQLDKSRAPPLKDAIISGSNANINDLNQPTAMCVYRSLNHLELLSPDFSSTLEERFCERVELDGGVNYRFFDDLTSSDIIELGYSKLVQGISGNDPFWFVRGVLWGKLTTLMAYLKCLAESCYATLSDDDIEVLNNVICIDRGYKKFRTTKFVDKVSEHLTKLRIRHETTIYANGILLDILEKDRNLVWLCNSYHRFYATTFDPTAESKMLDRLIRAFGFKTCHINYYQWGRLKARRTRFAFLRMARYYALNDQREYDHRYAGWSLPYVWWNASRQDQMHISNYLKYEP
ncbi:uncharacterized protein BXIN_0058 [Babesia sp. Xinjiang]|uniref:uncharacterized protein n=1 Tax=Babesia sp. Xinjiang TaxID=462227 RepID=UPI000A22DB4E|nr:uncharacterized protein BXIN_0058 [Babesia sp. Xinjiang]ORM39727.1 hypothetical protein BXIN_0058 [Babesia sp. Xinjiang]